MKGPSAEPHLRQLTGLTAKAERAVLIWIAKRLPPWVTPNRLTVLGICGGAMSGAGFILSAYGSAFLWLAIVGLLLHWFGDSLDGTTARVRDIERPRFGMFIDQAADLLTVFLLLAGIGLSQWARFDVAMCAYSGYLLLAVLVHLRASVTGIYDIAHDGIGPTEGRIVLIIATISLMFQQPGNVVSWIGGLASVDLLLIVITIWGVITCIREVWRVASQLALEEPRR
jgi:archaetidylinositol phosphate synthase